jgi:tetratricopeptide (TPR) repeat protein
MAYDKLNRKDTAIKILKYANRIDPTDRSVYKAKDKILETNYERSSSSSTQSAKRRRPQRRNSVRNASTRSKTDDSNSISTLGDAMESVRTGIMMEKATAGQGENYFNEALPLLRRALAANKSPAQVNAAIGTCLVYTGGDQEEAKKHFKASLAINPGEFKAAKELARIYKTDQKIEDELSVLETCVQSSGETPEISALLASAYGRRDQNDDSKKAIQYAQKAIDYDASYGASIVEEVTNKEVRKQVGIMMVKAEAPALTAAVPQDVQNKVKGMLKGKNDDEKEAMAKKFLGNEKLMDKIKARLGGKDPSSFMDKVPDKYKHLVDKYKDQL